MPYKNPADRVAAGKRWRALNRNRKNVLNQAYRDANREQINARARSARQSQPRKNREYQRYSRYGITAQQYATMLIEQRGKCAICSEIMDKVTEPHIDHNHATGQVRALLCRLCNVGLGKFRENLGFLNEAIAYLTFWRANAPTV